MLVIARLTVVASALQKSRGREEGVGSGGPSQESERCDLDVNKGEPRAERQINK